MKAIAAMASNRTIGMDGKLPWRIPGDLKFFRKMTMDGTMIMGRKTGETLPASFDFGTRRLQILSRFPWMVERGIPVEYKDKIEDLDKNGWVCGGAEIYKLLLPTCTDLYLTRIFKQYEGDTFFPSFEYKFKQWDVIERTDEYAIVHYKNMTPQ